MELRLHKNVTPDVLIKAGFKPSYSLKNIFRFRERLYKDSITLTIKIDLADDEFPIEWDVLDANTGITYTTFYYTPNTCRDLVREEVIRNFNEVVTELDNRKILYMEE